MDLAPSAYDTLTAALPGTHPKPLSDAERWAKLSANSSAKAAYSKAKLFKSNSTVSSRAKQKTSPLANESFVLLQDSVIHSPSQSPSSPRSKKAPVKTRNKLLTPQPAEIESPNPSPLSHHLRSTAQLFTLLSSRTEIDHPLCAECTQILLTSLNRQLEETKKERDGYIAFEKEVRKERDREGQGLSKEEVERKIERLKSDEASVIQQLKDAEREREQLDEQLRFLEQEEKALELEEAE